MTALEMADPVVSTRRWRRGGRQWAIYAVLIAGAIFMVYPFIWMVLSSFRSDQEIFSNQRRCRHG